MVEALEDYALFFEAEERLAREEDETYTFDQVLDALNIKEEDLEDIEVEIE